MDSTSGAAGLCPRRVIGHGPGCARRVRAVSVINWQRKGSYLVIRFRDWSCALKVVEITMNIMDLWVYDLSSLRFRADSNARTLSVSSTAGELLATVSIPEGTSEREAVFLTLDAALDSAKVVRGNDACGIAFYNPFTTQIAVSAVPDTVAYADGEEVDLTADGAAATLRDGILVIAGRELLPVETAMSSVAAAITAHRGTN